VNWGPLFEGVLLRVLCLFDFLVNIVMNAVHVEDFDGCVVLAEIFVGPY